MTSKRPIIAVTSGDPAGVGPEIIAHMFSEFRPRDSVALIIGAHNLFDPWVGKFGFTSHTLKSVDAFREFEPQSDVHVVTLHTGVDEPFSMGQDGRSGGVHAGRAVEIACDLASDGRIQAIVTAPISKKSLNLADFHFGGHTEMLAQYLNAPQCQMMMVYNNLRVVPMTRHLPLREVSDSVTSEALELCIRETIAALGRDFGVGSPRIAVAGLNPHAGESGVIGDEEGQVIAPALERLRAEGVEVDGPVPADALFQQAYCEHGDGGKGGGYDAYVSMYHDQGLIPFKMIAQRRGVNVTIGLPVVRTSVDHGVAFDIAGEGMADTESMKAAYTMAEEIAIRRMRAS